jgi:hypothetical protein
MPNVRYDDVVHSTDGESLPLCGDSMMPACAPEFTADAVTCIWCESLVS